jgi:general secretion pathway protein B
MSYILDALKKSEKERQKKNVPDLLTVQEPVLNEKRKRPLWPYILIAMLIMNMGFFGYLLGPKKSKETKADNARVQQQNQLKPMEAQKTEEAKSAMPAAAPSVKETSQPKQTVNENETRSAAVSIQQKKPLPEKAKIEDKAQEKSIVQSVKPPIKKETQSVQPQTALAEMKASAGASVSHEEKPVQTDAPPPVQGKIYNTGELPPTIQQSLPSVSVTISMYSEDPASRMVRVNGQTYREGQKIFEDLTLEQITPNGIILNYKNYRFRVGQQHQ